MGSPGAAALALVAALLPAAAGPAAAPPDPPAPPATAAGDQARELARIRDSLEQISRSLEALLRVQRAALLLERIAVEDRRIAPVGEELRRARQDRRGLGEEIERLKVTREALQQQHDEAFRAGRDAEAISIKEELARLAFLMGMNQKQADEADLRIRELESDLERARRALSDLDDRLQRVIERMLEGLEK